MANAARIANGGMGAAPGVTARHRNRMHASNFQHVLFRSLQVTATTGASATRPTFHATLAAMPSPVSVSRQRSAPASSGGADQALAQAMAAEGVPQSWQASLQFIMSKESAGVVDARSPVHSARGLFQLTAANYHYNPHGAASFGNAVEEAQGGIRYIRQRYGTADNAAAFWHQHHWY